MDILVGDEVRVVVAATPGNRIDRVAYEGIVTRCSSEDYWIEIGGRHIFLLKSLDTSFKVLGRPSD